MKKEYLLKNWTLVDYGKVLYAYGNVYDNPKFSQGYYIHTSFFESFDIDLENERFDAITHSGSHYVLPFNCVHVMDNTVKRILVENKFKPFDKELIEKNFEEWVEKSKKRIEDDILKEKEYTASFVEKIPEKSLYLEVFEDNTAVAIFHREHTDNSEIPLCINVPVNTHVGMFQDSILITDWEYDLVDYRYFPKMYHLETYHWSDGLERLIVKNTGNETITLDRTKIEPGETVTIEKNSDAKEGLFSPDAVNGKCLLNSKEE